MLRSAAFSASIMAVIFGGFWAARARGWLERWELAAYDAMLVKRHVANEADPGIVIIGIDEVDIRTRDYPLRDSQLAALLTKVLAANPKAVGMDMYRDLPEPRDSSELEQLNQVLGPADNLVTIFIPPVNGDPTTGVPPPPVLDKLPPDDRLARISVNNFVTDGNTVRRDYVLYGDGKQSYFSFAMLVAMTAIPAEAQVRNVAPPSPELAPDFSSFKLGKAYYRRFRANDGGYAAADDAGLQFLFDFKSPTVFPTASLREVMDPKFVTSLFTDHIVLIGNTAQSFKDRQDTPLDHQYPGVMLHAQMVNQILRNVFDGDPTTRVWPGWAKYPWALLWTILGGLTGFVLFRSLWQGVLVVAFGGFVLVVIVWTAFQHDWWLPFAEPGLDYLVTAGATLGLVFVRERQQRAQLMQLFSRHVSGKVAKSLWEQRHSYLEGGVLRSEKITATVLFSDFVGFSTVSEKFDAQQLMDWLNQIMERLAHQVEAHDGLVNKYIGDSVMALFGVPTPRRTPGEIEEEATNAVRCALAMGKELDDLNEYWKRAGKPQIGMRIGIFTGTLVHGTLGSTDRHEYTVIGDIVNTASRLESTRKDEIPPPPGTCCRILIGGATNDLLGEKFETEYVGEEQLKGKENKVSVYRVVREKISSASPTAETVSSI